MVTVRDAEGAGLPGITVTLRGGSGAIEFTTVTGAAGEAVFPAVPPGQYVVQASLAGFSVTERRVSVGLAASQSLELTLGVGPPPTTPPAPVPSPAPSATPRVPQHAVVRIHYATSRATTGERDPRSFYGSGRGDGLAFGTCDVSIPRAHKVGELETPWLRVFENPERHVVLLSLEPQSWDGYAAALRRRLAASRERSALVFVHGFNVSFEEAARRTAQLAWDLGFQGAPLLYSWPSQAELSVPGYAADEAAVEASIPHLHEFLGRVAAASGAEAVHVIAHSMGNRALTRALERFAGDKPLFREIVLAAPDIDADVFRDLARRFPTSARRVTLYGSSKDKAIAFSRRVHKAPRAGEGGKSLVVVPGVESIDASRVDTGLLGHSTYAERQLLADLFALLRGDPPDRRFQLGDALRGNLRYWFFKP